MAKQDGTGTREQWATSTADHRTDFAKAPSPRKFQVAAWFLWLAGIAVEFGAALCASGALRVPVLSDLPVLTVALAVVAGLAIVLLAQAMWKKAASLAAGKRQGALGVVMACAAFPPMCLFFLAAKNATGATKASAVVAALVVVAAIVACCWLLPGDPLVAFGQAGAPAQG